MNNFLKIVGLIITFVGCFVVGYNLPIGEANLPFGLTSSKEKGYATADADSRNNSLLKSKSSAKEYSKQAATVATPVEPVDQPLVFNITNVIVTDNNLYKLLIKASANYDDTIQFALTTTSGEAVSSMIIAKSGEICEIKDIPGTENGAYLLTASIVDNPSKQTSQVIGGFIKKEIAVPKEIKVIVAERHPNKPRVINRTATISATTESGELECIIKDMKGSEIKKQDMPNNRATVSVPPVDGGEYVVVVRNKTTNEEASITKGGFDKIGKWSASQLQQQLNTEARDRFLRHHFDLDKLQINNVGSNPVSSLDELLEAKSNGGTVRVVEISKYDKFNRIVSLTVEVTY